MLHVTFLCEIWEGALPLNASIYKYFFENNIFCHRCVCPLGLERAHWRLSNDCWVMYQIYSSWRREGRVHTVWMLRGVGKRKPEWSL